jgi:hypothetical protein
VFEHDNGIGTFGDGCAGHDLECGPGGERGGWRRLTGAEDSCNWKPIARGESPGLDGVAVAGGAVEWRKVAVGDDGCGEDAVEGIEKRERFGLPGSCGAAVRMILSSLQDESSGFGVGEDVRCHVGFILRPVVSGHQEELAPA